MGKLGKRCNVHRYQKLKDKLWHCSRCTHYMPANVSEQMEGRESICWNCGDEFLLDEITMDIDRPICVHCKNPQLKDIAAFLELKEREARANERANMGKSNDVVNKDDKIDLLD